MKNKNKGFVHDESLWNVTEKKAERVRDWLVYEQIRNQRNPDFKDKAKRDNVLKEALSMVPVDVNGALEKANYRFKQ